jgi:hypothetical protein
MNDHFANETLASLDLSAIRERALKPAAIWADETETDSTFKESSAIDAWEASHADVIPLLDALDDLVAERVEILKGARCPQCSATEWNGASRERNKNAALVEALTVHLDVEHHIEYESAGDEAHGNNPRCRCGLGVYPCSERIAIEAIITTNVKG